MDWLDMVQRLLGMSAWPGLFGLVLIAVGRAWSSPHIVLVARTSPTDGVLRVWIQNQDPVAHPLTLTVAARQVAWIRVVGGVGDWRPEIDWADGALTVQSRQGLRALGTWLVECETKGHVVDLHVDGEAIALGTDDVEHQFGRPMGARSLVAAGTALSIVAFGAAAQAFGGLESWSDVMLAAFGAAAVALWARVLTASIRQPNPRLSQCYHGWNVGISTRARWPRASQ